MWHWFDGMGWCAPFGGIGMIFVWIALIGLVVWGVIALTRRGGAGSDISEKHRPLDIARERYAKGEISKDEFEQIKMDLS